MDKVELETIKILRELKVPPHVLGYPYAKKAVDLVLNDQSLIHGIITTHLYPTIGKEFGTSPNRVERCIRHAFDLADPDAKSKLFGTPKVTNGQIIATLVEEIRIRMSSEERGAS